MRKTRNCAKRSLVNQRPVKKSNLNIKLGQYTASKISLKEAAINKRVLRVDIYETLKKRTKKANPPKKPTKSSIKKSKLKVDVRVREPRRVHNSTQTKSSMGDVKTREESYNLIIPQQWSTNSVIGTFGKSKFVRLVDEIRCYKSITYCGSLETFIPLLKNIKLPSSMWHISKLHAPNGQLISFNISNQVGRLIIFFTRGRFFKLILDNVPIVLLGCPSSITCIHELQILINIIHQITLDDCMVEIDRYNL